MHLSDLVRRSAERAPHALAIADGMHRITYAVLDNLANRCAHALRGAGVQPGQRVAFWLDKSAVAIGVMQGALRLGAAYVPLDPSSPAQRCAHIISECEPQVIVTTPERAEQLPPDCSILTVPSHATAYTAFEDAPSDLVEPPAASVDALAYILYTSGSTGRPKGVCISHRNALAFIDWATDTLGTQSDDRFSNHAPFHFDLSVLDLYAAFASGASIHVIPQGISYIPRRLVQFMSEHEITVWYSVPSALILMMESGNLLNMPMPHLRTLLFAGEVFPLKHVQRLSQHLRHAAFYNLYGPTETNVCTAHRITKDDLRRSVPLPIGRATCGNRVWAETADGREAKPGAIGELMVSGPTVMLGYFGGTPQEGPYATGDLVRMNEYGHYVYIGRRDHMVKVRGHRVELGEIESTLLKHPAVGQAAVLIEGSGVSAKLVAHIATRATAQLDLLALKKHCAERLPRYMIVDHVVTHEALPRTVNGKIDRLALQGTTSSSNSASRQGDRHAEQPNA